MEIAVVAVGPKYICVGGSARSSYLGNIVTSHPTVGRLDAWLFPNVKSEVSENTFESKVFVFGTNAHIFTGYIQNLVD